MIPELSCFDWFNLVNPETEDNKFKVVEQFKPSLTLIPAKMKEPSSISEELNHT